VIVHLLHYHLQQTPNMLHAIKKVAELLEGAYAFAVIYTKKPDQLFAVRKGSPLVIGFGTEQNFLASDTLALLPLTRQFVYLEEGDIAQLETNNVTIFDHQLKPVTRPTQQVLHNIDDADKGSYAHFMLKEMMEQPQAIANSLEGRMTATRVLPEILGPEAKILLPKIRAVQIVACGTSYHAGLVARSWIETIAKLPCHVDIASEFRYRTPILHDGTLLIAISQSGETADTMAALHLAKANPQLVASLAICNVAESALVRDCDLTLLTHAGKEIGVASTKAFTTQLTVLLLLSVLLARRQGLTAAHEAELVHSLALLPVLITKTLTLSDRLAKTAQWLSKKTDALFLGRGIEFPIALEGALKLKEISYIHAEGYAAGELKHGPLALVDENMPVICLVANDSLVDKVKSSIEIVQARGGQVVAITDAGCQLNIPNAEIITTPACPEILTPIIFTVPLQLLAYHTAILKGVNVDQPRNLAKSVTVE
jgi:glucosamine--fructose-6-phosphate aminotransferase (isomerizing)